MVSNSFIVGHCIFNISGGKGNVVPVDLKPCPWVSIHLKYSALIRHVLYSEMGEM